MSTRYASYIKSLRQQREFSQSFVAEKLGISRPSYIALEHGSRELSLAETQKLAALFGVSVEAFTHTSAPLYEKYKQMILAYLRSDVSNDGRVPKTKLAKLLYLADFVWYYEHLMSMSGMQYIKRDYGPVPDPYFRALAELEESGAIQINHKDDAMLISATKGAHLQTLDLLAKEEMSLIQDISNKWKLKRTQEIVKFTHEQLPYKLCAADEAIPYELITQQDPDDVY